MKMKSENFSFFLILICQIFNCNAGSCYDKIDREGKCSDPVANDVSKEECCGGMGIAYNDVISNQSFFMLLGRINTVSCKPCKVSTCDNFKCGTGKRCIMKKGQPKCICAPSCKASATINKNRRVGGSGSGGIEVIQLPEMKSVNRQYSVVRSASEMQSDEPTLIIASGRGRNLRQQKSNQSNGDAGVINTVRSLALPQNATVDDVARSIEMKFRSGFFNDIRFSPSYQDEFYLGVSPNFVHYNPVCGSDGKTYKNECQLRKRACRQENKKLDVSHKGFCQTSCKFINCLNGKQCIENEKLLPECVKCPKCSRRHNRTISHVDLKKIVCGTDGVSYRSLCELKSKSCKVGKNIGLAYRGPCKESLSCNHCSRNQKCLPDLLTARPVCVSCNRPYGRCPVQRSISSQVCGNNGKTYHSNCHLMKDSCNTGYFIGKLHEGKCRS